MNFERGIDPKESMKIGQRALAIKILSVRGGLGLMYLSDKNVHETLTKYVEKRFIGWSEGTRRLFEKKWKFLRADNLEDYSLIELTGEYLEFKGKYYKIPPLDEF